MKLLVDGFSIKAARGHQELRVLVCPSSVGLSSRTFWCLTERLAVRRERIGARWRRLTAGRRLSSLWPNCDAATHTFARTFIATTRSLATTLGSPMCIGQAARRIGFRGVSKRIQDEISPVQVPSHLLCQVI